MAVKRSRVPDVPQMKIYDVSVDFQVYSLEAADTLDRLLSHIQTLIAMLQGSAQTKAVLAYGLDRPQNTPEAEAFVKCLQHDSVDLLHTLTRILDQPIDEPDVRLALFRALCDRVPDLRRPTRAESTEYPTASA